MEETPGAGELLAQLGLVAEAEDLAIIRAAIRASRAAVFPSTPSGAQAVDGKTETCGHSREPRAQEAARVSEQRPAGEVGHPSRDAGKEQESDSGQGDQSGQDHPGMFA